MHFLCHWLTNSLSQGPQSSMFIFHSVNLLLGCGYHASNCIFKLPASKWDHVTKFYQGNVSMSFLGQKWLRSRNIFSLFPHLPTGSKRLQILEDGKTVRWKESESLNHWKGTPRPITLIVTWWEVNFYHVVTEIGGVFVILTSIILENITILCVLVLISLLHRWSLKLD